MARENLVILHGQVRSTPRLLLGANGEFKSIMVCIRVLRRPTTNSEISGAKLQVDCPVIYTRNPDVGAKLQDLEVGDMVDIRGVITSREVKKTTYCPHCEAKNSNPGNMVYVTPIYVCRREVSANDSDGLRMLKERAEISNLVNVIGNLCRDPQYYVDGNGKKYAQYQLAVNRRFRIAEDMADIRTDYPWVKTFGQQAYEDSQNLRTGSSVYISGAVQTREIERTSICESCGQEYVWPDNAAEIVPYYIGYLRNCGEFEDAEGGDAHGEAE